MTREEIKKAKDIYLKALDLYLLGEVSCICEGVEKITEGAYDDHSKNKTSRALSE